VLEYLFRDLIKDAIPTPVSPPESITIEIPDDHPKAQQLRELAKVLASQQRLPSGVMIKKLARPGATDEFIDFLREFGVDPDEVREIVRSHQPAAKLDPAKVLNFTRNVVGAQQLLRALSEGHPDAKRDTGL
jgi:hypothetical protein